MIGETLAHFKITGKLGEGGMGEVYRAEDTKLGREVALKVLPSDFDADPERHARFEREAKLLASLNHPNVAGIHGLEVDDRFAKRVVLGDWYEQGSVVRWDEDGLELSTIPRQAGPSGSENGDPAP